MKFGNFLFPASMDPSKDAEIIHETLREARLCDEAAAESFPASDSVALSFADYDADVVSAANHAEGRPSNPASLRTR